MSPTCAVLQQLAGSRLPPGWNCTVDNLDERLWRSCGPYCGLCVPDSACRKLWRTAEVLHSEERLIHRILHTHVFVWYRPPLPFPQFPQRLLLLVLEQLNDLFSEPLELVPLELPDELPKKESHSQPDLLVCPEGETVMLPRGYALGGMPSGVI